MIRTLLSRRLQGCPQTVELLADIDLPSLKLAGIAGIILDLDNTVVSEDDCWLSPNAYDWIEQAKRQGFKLFMLSNGKRGDRVRYWSKLLNILAISPARKPFPRSFRKALQKMRLSRHCVVVIGDSFHTDVVGAWLCGCYAIQVASLPHPPRVWERYIGGMVHIPYPRHRPLPSFERQAFEQLLEQQRLERLALKQPDLDRLDLEPPDLDRPDLDRPDLDPPETERTLPPYQSLT